MDFPVVALPGVRHMPAPGEDEAVLVLLCDGYAGNAEVGDGGLERDLQLANRNNLRIHKGEQND